MNTDDFMKKISTVQIESMLDFSDPPKRENTVLDPVREPFESPGWRGTDAEIAHAVEWLRKWREEISAPILGRMMKERSAAVDALRELCGEYGDNDWDSDLHLADVIEKHLRRHLDGLPDTSQWRDMADAPKDGTRIWCWFPHPDEAFAVKWAKNEDEEAKNWTLDDGESAAMNYDEPLSWMPLPGVHARLPKEDAKPAALEWVDKPTMPGMYWLSCHPGRRAVLVTWFGDDYYDQGGVMLNVNNPKFPDMAWLGPIYGPVR